MSLIGTIQNKNLKSKISKPAILLLVSSSYWLFLVINDPSSSNLSRDEDSSSNYKYVKAGLSQFDHPFSQDLEYSNPFSNTSTSSPPVK